MHDEACSQLHLNPKPAEMSLVPPGTPPSAPVRTVQTRRVQLTKTLGNWFFVHLLVCIFILFGFKISMHTYLNWKMPISATFNDSADAKTTMTPIIKSPLQELSWLEAAFDSLSDDDHLILSDIESRAALDIKFFAIPETVYSQEEKDNLYNYVDKQMKSARDVLTAVKQSEVVLKLIESGVAQGSMMKKEMGDKGSLKNSMVIALMKEQDGNLHFAMAAVSVEPRLGWRVITKKQRNVWNEVLNRVADARLKQQVSKLFSSAYGSKEVTEECTSQSSTLHQLLHS